MGPESALVAVSLVDHGHLSGSEVQAGEILLDIKDLAPAWWAFDGVEGKPLVCRALTCRRLGGR